MKIIFAGTPAFAATALAALIDAKQDIVAVYTQPDRPAGRGLKLTQSPVKQLASQHHLPVFQPASLKGEAEQAQLKSWHADVLIVAAYGLLLPQAVLDIPKQGCINIHPSLLPRWRGAAPIQRTIYFGDEITGVSIMRMDAGLDTGPVLWQETCSLAENETSDTLHNKLAEMGAAALLKTLHCLAENKLTETVQDDKQATYANKMTKEEALIDWTRSAHDIDCMIRAFNPWPMAYTHWQGERLRVGLSSVHKHSPSHDLAPGCIYAASMQGIDVVAGDKQLVRLLALQLPGGKMLSVHDFYHARKDELLVGKAFL